MLEHLIGTEIDTTDWAPLIGHWELGGQGARFFGSEGADRNVGLLMSPHDLRTGVVSCKIRIGGVETSDALDDPVGRIIVGYQTESAAFYSAGIGGFNHSYTAQEYAPPRGSIPLRIEGVPSSIERDREYEVLLVVVGQTLTLAINNVTVVQTELPHPFRGEGVGLECWGQSEVQFTDIEIATEPPKVFAVMEFGGPYDVLYDEVIRPVAEESGLVVVRADDVPGPGLILEDIRREIREAYLVIAEISPANRNVFYELGYAHASEKPTILLARKGEQLPFDVSGYRCIFYDDSIGGKAAVEEQLRQHLAAV